MGVYMGKCRLYDVWLIVTTPLVFAKMTMLVQFESQSNASIQMYA
jgi:hypothetical protein